MIVAGYKYSFERVGTAHVTCPHCGRQTQDVCVAKFKPTLYWVPLFTLSSTMALRCPGCGDRRGSFVKLTETEARELLAAKA
jgi:DNA-directed RNA polymerase subunit RPC12/RpoP